jgi:integrase
LEESEPRLGFFERAEFEAVRDQLPDYLKSLLTFYYWTGWRHEEVLSLEIRQVDLGQGIVRLDPSQSKNKHGRQFHFGPIDELRAVITEQVASAERLTREAGRIVTTLFHQPDGTPIKSFRRPWERARKGAGYPTKQVHDFRRTSARNMERAGVSRSVAMAMIGHKTEAMYRRYAIVDEARMREEAEKLNTFATGKDATKSAKVRQFRRRTG